MWGFLQNAPDWYNPQLLEHFKNVNRITDEPYKPYVASPEYLSEIEQSRIAPFSKLQQVGFEEAGREAERAPEYDRMFQESRGAIRDALGRDITSRINPFVERATANPVTAAREYMNPYNQAVIENIGKLGSRNLLENILPNVQDQFVRAGQYGSSRHQDLTNRAIRDTQEAISKEQANALRGGYSEALQTATGQQERQLQGGQLLGGSLGRDIERGIIGGRELQNLGESQQQARQRGIGFLGQIGGIQQQQGQNVRNTAYEDFIRQREHPFLQASRRTALTQGFQTPTFQAQTAYLPQPPSPSTWTQGAGLIPQLAGLAGMASQRQGFSHGGKVSQHKSHIRHYADGGGVPNNPIQLGVNDALDTSEINFMRDQAAKLSQPQVDPFWSALMTAGAHYAQNPQLGGGLGKLSHAISAGVGQYRNELSHQDQRNIAATKLHDMIGQTRQWQMKHNLDISKHKHDIEYDKERLGLEKSRLGIEQSKLGMMQSKHDQDMALPNLLNTNKGVYEITKDDQGNTALKILTPEIIESKSLKSRSGKSVYDKSDQESLSSAAKTLEYLPALNTRINELENVIDRLDTGGISGTMAGTVENVPLIGGIAKSGLAAKESLFGNKSYNQALTDIDNLVQESNSLVLDLGNQLKGNQVAMGKIELLKRSKPGLNSTKQSNQENIRLMKDIANMAEEQASLVNYAVQNGYHAIEAKKIYNAYIKDKSSFEKKSNGKEKYLTTPEKYFDLHILKKGQEPINIQETKSNSDIKLSNDDIRKQLGLG